MVIYEVYSRLYLIAALDRLPLLEHYGAGTGYIVSQANWNPIPAAASDEQLPDSVAIGPLILDFIIIA